MRLKILLLLSMLLFPVSGVEHIKDEALASEIRAAATSIESKNSKLWYPETVMNLLEA